MAETHDISLGGAGVSSEGLGAFGTSYQDVILLGAIRSLECAHRVSKRTQRCADPGPVHDRELCEIGHGGRAETLQVMQGLSCKATTRCMVGDAEWLPLQQWFTGERGAAESRAVMVMTLLLIAG